jgi:hypothetical protein
VFSKGPQSKIIHVGRRQLHVSLKICQIFIGATINEEYFGGNDSVGKSGWRFQCFQFVPLSKQNLLMHYRETVSVFMRCIYSMEQSPPEKLKRPELLKKFLAFYGTRRLITVYTRAHHLSLS